MLTFISRLPQLFDEVPGPWRGLFTIGTTPGISETVAREGRTLRQYELLAFNAFLWAIALAIPTSVLAAFLLPRPFPLLSPCIAIIALMVPAWTLSAPSRTYRSEQRAYLLGSPTVVGAMTMNMNRTPSLERALETGARTGEGKLQRSLWTLAWKAMTGEICDLRQGLSSWTATLDPMNEGLRRSIHLIIAAEGEGRDGRNRLLERANGLVLEGLREASDRYIGSLSFPVMLVFAFGVLAPVMLFSLVPLMGMDGGEMDLTSLAVLLLLIVPGVTLAYVRSILGRNPLRAVVPSRPTLGKRNMCVLITLPFFPLAYAMSDSVAIATISTLFLGLFTIQFGPGKIERRAGGESKRFVDGLYRLGNAMAGGKDLEAAASELAKGADGSFESWIGMMVHETRTGRKTLAEVIRCDRELEGMDPVLRENFLTVIDCAKEDHRGAGRVAIDLAQCQSDLDRARTKMRESLRPVIDMMSSTGLIFAPIIIGLTTGIMGLLGGSMDRLIALASLYVVELVFLVNYFTSNLEENMARRGLRTYAWKGAVALTALLTASLCGQSLLFRLL